MATVHCVLGSCLIGSRAGITVIPSATPAATPETITSSGASQATTAAAPAGEGEHFWSVTATGGPVWVQIAAAPVAAAGQDWLLLDGQSREWAAPAGSKVAVIDA